MTRLLGTPIAVAVHRDTTALCWRARCFDPPFIVEAADNRTLVAAIETAFDQAFAKDRELVKRLGLTVAGVEAEDRVGHYAVPYYCTRVG